jgi:hypothetical protein
MHPVWHLLLHVLLLRYSQADYHNSVVMSITVIVIITDAFSAGSYVYESGAYIVT